MNSKGAENLVMGFATNLEPKRIEIFAKTLRRIYPPDECDLVLYVHTVSDELRDLAKKYCINFTYTYNNYTYSVGKFSKAINRCIIYPVKWLAKLTRNIPSLKVIFYDLYPVLIKLWHHPQIIRFLYYMDFLSANRTYKKIFISDVKDVAFQAPFFNVISDPGLSVFGEDKIFGTAYWNTLWYRTAYGIDELKKIEGKEAFNVGTVLGGFGAVEKFLSLFCGELLKHPFGYVEQAVFNKLYYSGALNKLPVKAYKNAEILLTIADPIDPLYIKYFKVASGGVYNSNGQLIPIIHMYDRNVETLNYFQNIITSEN